MSQAMQQLILLTSEQRAESIGDILFGLDAVSVTFQDAGDNPIFEPEHNTMPLWEQTYVIGLFQPEVDLEGIIKLVQRIAGLNEKPEYRIEAVPDRDWERAWMDEFKPMKFGDKLWFVPSWTSPPDPQAVNINLDPGLAFGTGTHQTTALCLEWLATHDIKEKTVIDYGCGSGILAIAAAKLGAKTIWAVDIHPQALEASLENAKNNQVEQLINICHPDDLPELSADLLIANILAEPLLSLAPKFANLVSNQGNIILSGILKEQADSITQTYQQWFTMQEPRVQDEWCLIAGSR